MPVAPKARPDWAQKIELLRETLSLSQAALAKILNVSPMAPSRWERGINRPPSSVFLRLGKLVGHPLCWYFWEQAGLRKEDLLSCAVPEELAQESQGPLGIDPQDYVSLPLLPGETQQFEVPEKSHVDDYMVARRDWCPNPDQTICWQYNGKGMKPLLAEASIIAIDLSQTDRSQLDGKMVLARHAEHGPRVKWLLREGHSLILKPENPDVPSYDVGAGGWQILGRVIWWFRRQDV